LWSAYEPALVSEHLAWSTHETTYFNDLLPLPYTEATLARVADHIGEVQEAIRRPILLENPSTYVLFRDFHHERDRFIRELARRSGCGLLLDVNNVFVSATNHGFSALDYLSDFPLERVGEIHLAGHAEQSDDEGERLLIDSHDGPVADAVWTLFDIVLARCGPIPTLVEWDSRFPIGPYSRPRPWRHRPSWIVTRRHSYSDRPMLPADICSRDPRKKPSYGAAFSGALIDPERATPNCVAGPNGKTATKRYNVYRNNVTVSLIEALASIYPAVQRNHRHGVLPGYGTLSRARKPASLSAAFEYGCDFPDFIERYEYARSLPWLADVARIERAWLDCYHAADAEPLSATALASVPADRLAELVFLPHPAVRIVRSSFSAVSIFAANRNEEQTDQIQADAPEDALITRPAHDVVVRHLPAGGATFLTRLIEGSPLPSPFRPLWRWPHLRPFRQYGRHDRCRRFHDNQRRRSAMIMENDRLAAEAFAKMLSR